MSRMGKVLELVLVAFLARFAANIVPSLVGCFLSLIRLGGLRRGTGGKPGENSEKQTADQQRSNGFVRRQLSVLSLSLADDQRRLTRNRPWCLVRFNSLT